MPISWSPSDLSIFEVPDFSGRMTAMREKIRPKLELFGETMQPLLLQKFHREFFPHTAKHMRRKVNPPDETWVALGPQARGYKAYIFFALCIGKYGVQARVVMKDESATRPQFGKTLLKKLPELSKRFPKSLELREYTKSKGAEVAPAISDFKDFIQQSAERLQNLKSALFDVGIELNPKSKSLEQDFLKACEKLYPIFECGLSE